MKKNRDVFGNALYDFYRGKGRGLEIIEREDGYFFVSAGPDYYFAEYKNWPQTQKIAIKYAKGRVIDIGCGAGRVSLYLESKGLKVLAIDISPLAIKVCKLQGANNVKVMSITQISSKIGQFDTILMFGNNFGLFANQLRAKSLLKRFHSITKPDTLLIAESRDPYKSKQPDDIEYRKLNKLKEKMAGQWKIRVRYKKYISNWHEFLFVSKNEMKRLLNGTGWKVKKFIESPGGSYIAIIQKS